MVRIKVAPAIKNIVAIPKQTNVMLKINIILLEPIKELLGFIFIPKEFSLTFWTTTT